MFSKCFLHFRYSGAKLFAFLLLVQAPYGLSFNHGDRDTETGVSVSGTETVNESPRQFNCTDNPAICKNVCNETNPLPWSSTFCDHESGSCVCDCRDIVPKNCEKTPFTPCFQGCVTKNPNPDVFLYEGGNCPISQQNSTALYQCTCECTVRDDYYETNDIL